MNHLNSAKPYNKNTTQLNPKPQHYDPVHTPSTESLCECADDCHSPTQHSDTGAELGAADVNLSARLSAPLACRLLVPLSLSCCTTLHQTRQRESHRPCLPARLAETGGTGGNGVWHPCQPAHKIWDRGYGSFVNDHCTARAVYIL